MSRRERVLVWLVLLATTLFLLAVLQDVMLPFVAGMAIAYFLDPVVDRFETWRFGRGLATFVVLLLFFLLAVGVILLIVPVLEAQVVALVTAAPAYFEKLRVLIEPLLQRVAAMNGGDPLAKLPAAASDLVKIATRVLRELVTGGVALANLLSLIFITPVVAFYLLRDWDRMIAVIDGWLPQAQAPVIRAQVGEIDRTLSAFVRGQGSVCLILGVLYGTALSLAGLQFGLIIGLFSGIISFVPFVGALLGGAISIGLALLQFESLGPVALVTGIYLVGQVLEGNFLTPRLVGGAVGLHPVWVIFSLLAGGALFGFLGVLIAVPAMAVIGVLARFALSRYLVSPLHLHGIPPAEEDERDHG